MPVYSQHLCLGRLYDDNGDLVFTSEFVCFIPVCTKDPTKTKQLAEVVADEFFEILAFNAGYDSDELSYEVEPVDGLLF